MGRAANPHPVILMAPPEAISDDAAFLQAHPFGRWMQY